MKREHQIYCLGQAYRILQDVTPLMESKTGMLDNAVTNPITGLAAAMQMAQGAHKVTKNIDKLLGEILDDVDPDVIKPPIPLSLQGYWWMGYYAGADRNIIYASQIIDARKSAGLTQQQLAEKVGVSQRDMSFYENGKLIPSQKVFDQIIKACDDAISGTVNNHEPKQT